MPVHCHPPGVGTVTFVSLYAMTLTILELAAGSYVQRAVLTGDMELAVTLPFAMTVIAGSIFS